MRLIISGFVLLLGVVVAHANVALPDVISSGMVAVTNGHANGHGPIGVDPAVVAAVDAKFDKIREARLKGYEGDSCGECGNFTLVRNGTCLKCTTCGSTSGCS